MTLGEMNDSMMWWEDKKMQRQTLSERRKREVHKGPNILQPRMGVQMRQARGDPWSSLNWMSWKSAIHLHPSLGRMQIH